MFKSDGNGGYYVKKENLQILGLIVTLLVIFAGIISYSVSASKNTEKLEQKVDINKKNTDEQLTFIRTDITEIKADIKTLLSR